MADLSKYDPVFEDAGRAWNVDPLLLKSIAGQESGGRKNAISPAGAEGLMQIMPGTQRALGMTDPNDPVQSIFGGAKYLAEGLDREGSPAPALLFYHGGPNWRQAYGPESKAYVPAVAARYAKLAAAGTPPPATPAATDSGPEVKAQATAEESPTDFLKRTTGKSQPADTPGETPADFLRRTAPRGDETAKAADTPTPTPTPDTPYGAAPYDPNDIAPDPRAVAALSSGQGMRNALRPEPGYVRAPIPLLPLAFRETTPGSGQIDPTSGLSGLKFDPGAAMAPVLNPLLDLLEGTGLETSMGGQNAPRAGKVSPAASALLLGTMAGNPNPFQSRNALMAPRLTEGPPSTPTPSAGDLRAAPLPADFKAAPMTPEGHAAAVASREAPGAPSTPTGIPAASVSEPPPTGPPGAVGAQVTPPLVAGLTAKEIALYQRTAEGQKLMEGQQIGVPDRNAYVSGVTPNAAEQEQTAAMARELKALGMANPHVSDEVKLAAQDNAQRRIEHLQDTVKSPADLDLRERAREADIQEAKPTVFAPENLKGPVDVSPVIEHMQTVLNEPFNRQNTALQAAYKPWLERLQAFKDGIIENPEEAWGLRYDIDQQTDKFASRDNPNMHRIGRRLNDAADVLDQQIEKVAPGYRDMLDTYKEHSRAIEEMRVLQEAEPGLKSGPGQSITFNSMQAFMRRVVKARSTGAADINPYKSISPETMDRLWALRDDARRSSSAMELAKAAGSDTTQNAMDIARQYGKMLGSAGIMALAHKIAPIAGPMMVRGAQAVAAPIQAARLERRQGRRARDLLNPPNPLINPNAPP